MAIISVEVNDAALRKLLLELQQKFNDPTPAYRQAAEYMLLATDIRFEKEIDPAGKPWKQLSAYTIAQKRALGRIQKINQSTGRMRGSITYQVNSRGAVIGTNVKYAAKNQKVRSFLGFSDDDVVEIRRIFTEFLTN